MRSSYLTVAAALLVATPAVSAPSTQQLKQTARRAYDEGRFRDAANAYLEWFKRDKDVRIVFNAANALEQAGDCKQALSTFRQARQACAACEHLLLISTRIEGLRQQCGDLGPDSELARAMRSERLTRQAEGHASITIGQRGEPAVRLALANAHERALVEASEVYVPSMLMDESSTPGTGGTEAYRRLVANKVRADTAGFVVNTKVLKQWEDNGVANVLTEVELDNTTLVREMRLLARKYAQARFPKLVFAVHEEYTNKKGVTSAVPEPQLRAMLEGEFLKRGFDVIDSSRVAELQQRESSLIKEIVGDPSKAAQFAIEQGADYIVTGVARTRFTSENDFKQGDVHGTAEISVRCILAATGHVVASEAPPVGHSPAAAFSEEEMRVAAVRHVGGRVIKPTIDSIVDFWISAEQRGVRYVVALYGAPSYKREGRAFGELLREIPGVRQVKSISDAKQYNKLEVFYTSLYDVSKLKNEILDGAQRRPELKDIDLYAGAGENVAFAFPSVVKASPSRE